jgi:hypothetical protein
MHTGNTFDQNLNYDEIHYALRTYILKRYHLEKSRQVESIVIHAHDLDITPSGIIFIIMSRSENGQYARIGRAFRSWIDIEEIVDVPSSVTLFKAN